MNYDSIQIIIFPTKTIDQPSYRSNIDYADLYSSFSIERDLTILSGNLWLISQHELELYDVLRSESKTMNKYQHNQYLSDYSESTLNLARSVLTKRNNFSELYSRDDGVLLKKGAYMYHYPPLAVVITVNGIYRGHVYAWSISHHEDPALRVMNIMGIRTSMHHLLNRFTNSSEPSLAPIMFDGIRKYCNIHYPNQTTWLRIVSPMPIIQNIADKLGFDKLTKNSEVNWLNTEITDDEYLDEDWLLQVSYIGGGPVTSEEEVFDKSSDRVLNSKIDLDIKTQYKLIDLDVLLESPIVI